MPEEQKPKAKKAATKTAKKSALKKTSPTRKSFSKTAAKTAAPRKNHASPKKRGKEGPPDEPNVVPLKRSESTAGKAGSSKNEKGSFLISRARKLLNLLPAEMRENITKQIKTKGPAAALQTAELALSKVSNLKVKLALKALIAILRFFIK